ncbi:MAG: hypothetical protein CFH37_00190 [Alphaproteobacteria bacterium MarineAlpha9_Bin7]|nr:MAG: hypothetical protein CFH37_00190 [Alphaproteobacteria bacterium MarineAlpha9_Bin7]
MHTASNSILLSATIAALLSVISPVGAVVEPETGAEWVASADEPGPDVPPVGRSLFDYLFTERINGSAEYRVPFPFEKLTAQIEMYLRATSTRSLQKVLIPLGRSLQRNAASPHFFKSPRAVVAAEANPAPVPGEPLVVLKDRLYLGYQPSAAAIEVISYNEAAGRFEFQIVEDYRPGGKPKVYYAERSICLGCHQNHAPIFAIQPWDESNSNPSVSTLLRREQPNFYGIPSFTGIDIPGLIGLSADRANLFSTYQLIWREGCGANDTAESTKCRANALLAALRYRLAADTHAGTRQDEARSTLVARFRETWPENWPTGIAIPSRELPDLDPFGSAKTYLGNGAIREVDILENLVPIDVVSIDDEYEPLYPRAPLEVWDLPRRMLGGAAMEPSWLDEFIAGLGEFLVPQDIELFDQLLAENGGAVLQYNAPCEIKVIPNALVDTMLSFSCRDVEAMPTLFSAEVRVQLDDGELIDGLIKKLRIDPYGPAGPLKAVDGKARQTENSWRLVLKVRASNDHASLGELGRHPRINARLPTGELISEIVLEWDEPDDSGHNTGSLSVTVLNDIDRLKIAVANLATQSENGLSDALVAGSFRRSALLPPLLESLGMAPVTWCCLNEEGFPPVEVVGE